MGARPSSFRKSGGGFLNGVDGVITDYQFTDEFNGKPFVDGKNPVTKKENFHSLYCVLSAQADGADEAVTTTLFAGGYDDWDVSEDGHVLTPADGQPDDQVLGQGTGFAKFISSLVAPVSGGDGFPEERFPEDETDFSAMIGTRVRFIQKEDEAMKGKKRKDKKTGKEYAYTNVLVDAVYDLPSAKGKVKATATKTTNGKKTKSVEVDLQELSGQALVEILTRAGKPVIKSKLSTLVLTTPMLKNDPNKEAVRKWVFVDENLNALEEAGTITYDSKTQMISLAEAEEDEDAA